MSTQYFIRRGSQATGPIDVNALKELAASGAIAADDEISKDEKTWMAADKIIALDLDSKTCNGPSSSSGIERPFDVFISYSSHNKLEADVICGELEAVGIRCWIAPRDIVPGTEWAEGIIDGIDKSRIMVLVFSEHANDSPQVRREVERAINRELTLIPLRVQDVLPTRAMEYCLGNTHWLDAFDPPLEQHVARLISVVRGVLDQSWSSETTPKSTGTARRDAPETAATREPRARLHPPSGHRLKWIAFAAIAITLLICAVATFVPPMRPRSSGGEIPGNGRQQVAPAAIADDPNPENHSVQVEFLSPEGMSIGWAIPNGFAENQLVAPGLQVFQQCSSSRLKLQHIPGRQRLVLYPILEVYPAHRRSNGFLSQSAVPIAITDEDLDQVQNRNIVTKVVYVPRSPSSGNRSLESGSAVVTRIGPGDEAVGDAERLGTVILVLRIGNIDLELNTEDDQSEPVLPDASAPKEDGARAGDVRDDNALAMKMVWCPAGRFTMGSPTTEKDRHDDEDQVEVMLTKGFWLGKYEVTQAEWKQVMGTEPWKGRPYVKEGANYPASFLSWHDTQEFCSKLSDLERRAGRPLAGLAYGLPTEAEWEYACRAGTTTRYCFGDNEKLLGEYAWFDNNAHGTGERYAHQVGQKQANTWGLHDMHGNVWEWCEDDLVDKLPGGRDPAATIGGSHRVIRGGHWGGGAETCRSAVRNGELPSARIYCMGFRVALGSVQ